MRSAPTLLLMLCACGAGRDDDYDGIPASEDCDDADPLVYPGAPDAPGDGLDSDCDGIDPEHRFLGAWTVVDMGAALSSFQVLVPGTAEGDMEVSLSDDCALGITVALDPEIAPVNVDVLMEGVASAMPIEGVVQLDLRGTVSAGSAYEEQSSLTFVCEVDEELLDCTGVLKALDANLSTWAIFER